MTYTQHKVQQFKNKAKKTPTKPELDLLNILRGYGLNVTFQKLVKAPKGYFILDFVINVKPYAIIELDGSSHYGKESYDKWRQEWIQSTKKYAGYKFLRFTNQQVYTGEIVSALKGLYPHKIL